jgi:hypothetical protein
VGVAAAAAAAVDSVSVVEGTWEVVSAEDFGM